VEEVVAAIMSGHPVTAIVLLVVVEKWFE